MPTPSSAQIRAQFVVFIYNEHKMLDAAAIFESYPDDAFRIAAERAAMAGAFKFQVYAIEQDASGSLTFSRIEKSGRAK